MTADHIIEKIREDDGLWRFWNTKAKEYLARAEAAEAERDVLRNGLERLRDATPGSTNSGNAIEAFRFVRAVSNHALNTAAMPRTLAGGEP